MKGTLEGSRDAGRDLQLRAERISNERGRAACSQVVQVDVTGRIRGALHDVDDAVDDPEVLHHEAQAAFWLSPSGSGVGFRAAIAR
ncbi:hypothetical protein [Anaeromyxobacter soli]|uniref:hypothetical protein n=1 Tax=Anaeromyxobacter soli TaxID=2922725 RepID=UPI001FAF70A7|nr:hypothetical protein [Anaeromyxobacter sp. SG29]